MEGTAIGGGIEIAKFVSYGKDRGGKDSVDKGEVFGDEHLPLIIDLLPLIFIEFLNTQIEECIYAGLPWSGRFLLFGIPHMEMSG